VILWLALCVPAQAAPSCFEQEATTIVNGDHTAGPATYRGDDVVFFRRPPTESVPNTGPGNDSVCGRVADLATGPGNDRVDVTGIKRDGRRPTLHAGAGDDTVTARHFGYIHLGAGDDVSESTGFSSVTLGSKGAGAIITRGKQTKGFGMTGNDTLTDYDAPARFGDYLSGGHGNDTLSSPDGNTRLYGETGEDHLIGSPFSDTLGGGRGADTCDGGGAGDDEIQSCEMVVGVP
jgi:Ca2+-binding RTX toxin-like protein